MDEKRQKEQWTRLKMVIQWSNMSTNHFAHHIGLARGENLYQIKRGNNGISLRLAERIQAVFPEINKLWLLTGDGEMFLSAHRKPITTSIPFYDVDVEQGLLSMADLAVTEYLLLPIVACDFAMTYTGKAMGQQVPKGALVLLQRSSIEELTATQCGVVVAGGEALLRNLTFDPQRGEVHLEAADAYIERMTRTREEIDTIYLVKGVLTYKAI